MTDRIEEDFVIQDHVAGAFLHANRRELLAGLFHVADANAVHFGRRCGHRMPLVITALERPVASFELGEVALETAVIQQTVMHRDLRGTGDAFARQVRRSYPASDRSATARNDEQESGVAHDFPTHPSWREHLSSCRLLFPATERRLGGAR